MCRGCPLSEQSRGFTKSPQVPELTHASNRALTKVRPRRIRRRYFGNEVSDEQRDVRPQSPEPNVSR